MLIGSRARSSARELFLDFPVQWELLLSKVVFFPPKFR